MAKIDAAVLEPDQPEACCGTGRAVPEDAARELARSFRALGDPARVQLLALVAAHDGGEACVCDLIEPVGLSQATVSHHLKILVDSGLLAREQRGRWAYYRLEAGALASITERVTALLTPDH